MFFFKKSVNEVDAATAAAWLKAGEAVLVDVREPGEIADAAAAEAILLPMSRVSVDDYPDFGAKKVLVICHSGARSARIAAALTNRGVPEVYNVARGMIAWCAAGLPVVANRTV